MGIALSGFIQQYDSTTSVEQAKQRQQDEAQRRSSTGNERGQQNPRSREENNQRTPPNARTERIIDGEVLSSKTSRVNVKENGSDEKVYQFSRSSNQQAPSGQADIRKISLKLALQTFQDNEALIAAEQLPRQISGLIDEFV